MLDNNSEAFLTLVRAGLWEKDTRLLQFGYIDYKEVYRIAEYQAVTGLVAAGLEHIVDLKAPKEDALLFVGSSLQIEQRNLAMNSFIASLYEELKVAGHFAILVKGQGIAQCYERPLWRMSGDIDLLLKREDLEKARESLGSSAQQTEEYNSYTKHLALSISSWEVELHGSLRSTLSGRVDGMIDRLQEVSLKMEEVRKWQDGQTEVYLPSYDNDAIFIFCHILQHYYHGGIGLRQVCDWCRLLWRGRDQINRMRLENELRRVGIMTEWKAFAYLVVNRLGAPEEAIPFYENKVKWKRKSERVLNFIMKTGNFSHRDLSYVKENTYTKRKALSFLKAITETVRHFATFPSNSIRFFFYYSFIRMKAYSLGE